MLENFTGSQEPGSVSRFLTTMGLVVLVVVCLCLSFCALTTFMGVATSTVGN